MKRQNSRGPRWGKLVHQFPKGVTFAYDLHLGCMITSLKGLSDDYTFFFHTLANAYSVTMEIPKNCCLGPQNGGILGLKML
jgi:hypothetical protein